MMVESPSHFSSLILGIETTATQCSVAVSQNGSVVATIDETIPYNQANHLMGFIERALRTAEVDYGDLTAIAVNRGPGSFTGIRVGMATAQALAFAGNLPLLGLTGFEIMRHRYARGRNAFPLLIALDTRRRDYYTAYYESPPANHPAMEILSEQDIRARRELTACFVLSDVPILIEGEEPSVARAADLLHAVAFYARHDPTRFDPTPFYMRPPSVYE